MFGGVGKSAGWAAILGSMGVMLGASVSAQAADLGGDCCADLEERVAELEATTARKGNRKVSLTISGWVNEAVFWWDDGTEQNVYVGTNDLEQSRFRFTGEAKIDKDWSAGYIIEVGVRGDASGGFSQTTTNPQYTLQLRKSNWYIKSKTYGQVAVGLNGSATYHLLDDADLANTRNFADAEAAAVAMGAFALRSGGKAVPGGLLWKDVLRGFNNSTPGQAGRREVVRYDSPTFAGFTLTAAWGADDLWDAALTYKNDLGDFSVLGKVGYGNSTDNDATSGTGCNGPIGNFECQWAGAAGTVMHKPTGLYVFGGYGWQKIDSLPAVSAGVVPDDTSTTWFIQPGIEHKWHPLGKTTIFGEYRKDDAGANMTSTTGTSVFTTRGSDINFWAGGVVQNIEAAAMDLYVIYRHADGSYTDKAGAVVKIDDFDMVMSGAMIKF